MYLADVPLVYYLCFLIFFFFFFSSRRRHTRLTCDWSSDVCSSDLVDEDLPALGVDRGDGDLQAPADERVLDELERGRQRPEQRVAADEPLAGALGRGRGAPRRAGRRLAPAGDVDRVGHRLGQPRGEADRPVNRPPGVILRLRLEEQVVRARPGDAERRRPGRDAALAERAVEALLVAPDPPRPLRARR